MVYVFFNPFNQSVLDMDDFVTLSYSTSSVVARFNGQPLVFMQFFSIFITYGCFAVQGWDVLIGKDDCGLDIKARAMATRCFCPPDNSLGI